VVIAALADDAEAEPGTMVVDTEVPPAEAIAAPTPSPTTGSRPVIDPVPPPSPPPPDSAAAAQAAAQSQALRRGRVRRAGWGTFRVVWWVLPVVIVLVVAVGAVWWHARRNFFVGIDDGVVTVYRGVPGGLLGWDPTVERRTALREEDLTPAQREDLRDGHPFSSEDGADRFVGRLRAQTTTTTTTTTTTLPFAFPFPPPSTAPGAPAP
jgi:protein phosphatase